MGDVTCEMCAGVLAERGQEHVCKLAGCSLGSEQEGHEQASASAGALRLSA